MNSNTFIDQFSTRTRNFLWRNGFHTEEDIYKAIAEDKVFYSCNAGKVVEKELNSVMKKKIKIVPIKVYDKEYKRIVTKKYFEYQTEPKARAKYQTAKGLFEGYFNGRYVTAEIDGRILKRKGDI